MGWIIGIIALLALGGWAALQYAISRNGPAVLDTVDRITGGSRSVALGETAVFGESPAQKLLVFNQDGTEPKRPVVIFVHGGSWRSGDPDDYGFIARALVPEGFVVVLAGYRLGDAGRFPAMLEDTADAIDWVHSNIGRLGGDPDAIFLAGHSAGAYNVAMTALDRQWLGRKGLGDDVVKGVIGLAGPYDFYPFDSDSTIASFGKAPRPERTQPVNYVRGDAPPMLLMSGEQDTTVKPRNSRALAAALRDEGARVETEYFTDYDHTGILTATASPWRSKAGVVDRMTRFMRQTLAEGQSKTAAQTQPSVPVQAEMR